ncbi:hypothetical protein [Vannielia litorea]|uniref:hypothetical protein n=1 Tax=Vannielia litorea TaxID=1217970 RepID=UPI001BCF863A|nr:hypothetical protein [Vannielia litorea]MBS8227134.1 hypothetical protein [Vannielia litorea]
MLDANEAGIGHNNPPPYDPEALSEHKSKADEFLAVTQQWLGLEKIETEEHAAQVTDQLDGLRGLYKKVDGARKAAKKPHDDAGKAVQAAYSPILTKLQRAADALKPKLGAYVEAKARREAEAKRKAEDEARREAAAAERALREAEASGDISAQVEAEEKAKAAEKAAKEAQKAPDTRVRSASGAGRTMSMRTVKEVEVVNINVLFLHYRDHPEVKALLQRLATADVRATGYDHAADPVPGITVTERKVMA